MHRRIAWQSVVFHVLMVAVTFVMVYPALWMISGTFKTNQEIMSGTLSLVPSQFSFDSYTRGWAGFGGITFATFFRNSIIIAGFSTIGALLSSSLVAFGFARIKFAGSRIWFAIMVMTLMLPYQVVMVPQYVLFRQLGWINSFLPIIVPQFFGFAFFIFLTMQFIRGIPKELDESAYLDGANRFRIFRSVILPNIHPALITVAIFSFYWRWNEFLEPLIYLSNPRLYPVSVALQAFSDPDSTLDWSAIFSMGVVSVIPVMAIFLIFQRYLVEGITTTGLKG